MNKHRHQFVYQPLQRWFEGLSGPGRRLIMCGKAMIIISLVVLTLLRTNLIYCLPLI